MVSQPKIDYINRLIDESLSEGDDTIELKGKFIGDEGVEALVQSTGSFFNLSNSIGLGNLTR